MRDLESSDSLDGVRAAVVVVGDLGRSPRMQHHALALAAHAAQVVVVGYRGRALPGALLASPRITLHYLGDVPEAMPDGASTSRYLASRLLRAVWTSLRLTIALLARPRFDLILVQTPPAIPTLPAAWLAARCVGARLIVDWHNSTAAMLALRLGRDSRWVAWMARWERALGRRADGHLFVSRAQAARAAEGLGEQPCAVLHDAPPAHFQPTPPVEAEAVLRRLDATPSKPDRTAAGGTTGETPSGRGRPAILVAPTSFTPDEDLSVLLEAVQIYSRRKTAEPLLDLPDLIVFVTGDGPGRKEFESRVAGHPTPGVELRTAWLAANDYALLLGAADLGLCFHRSASGLDLPMKLADMRGAGLPACALDYGPVLDEILTEGREGWRFENAGGLAALMADLLAGLPEERARWTAARRSLVSEPAPRWEESWSSIALPLILQSGVRPRPRAT